MPDSNVKRILLVDDEETVLFVIRESLEKLGLEADIIAVTSGREALSKVEKYAFDLVITDLKMPEVNGFQLTEGIRALSPETPIIWMTAFGNQYVQEKAQAMNVRHFLSKPLDITDIRKIAREAIESAQKHKVKEKPLSLPGEDAIWKRISQLKTDTNAFAILLITLVGNVIESAGVTQDLDVNTLSVLIAGNFMASNQIARMLGRDSNFRLSYYESDRHNIYSYGVGENYLLVTVFGRETRPGVVWFYTQHAADDLANLIATTKMADPVGDSLEGLITEQVETELNAILNTFWGTDVSTQNPEETATQNKRIVSAKKKGIQSAHQATPVSADTMSYQDAIRQGLIPEDIG